jgi:hypothetical protein
MKILNLQVIDYVCYTGTLVRILGRQPNKQTNGNLEQ